MEAFSKSLDLPPIWLGGGIVVIGVLGLIEAWIGLPLGFGSYGPGLALACAVLGLWLIGSAIWQMRSGKTTLDPRGQPSTLITDGVFGLSRNPIYLGGVMLLLAASFWGDAVLGLLVVAGFVWVINDRFIAVEEDRLKDAFGDAAAHWFLRVRRWL